MLLVSLRPVEGRVRLVSRCEAPLSLYCVSDTEYCRLYLPEGVVFSFEVVVGKLALAYLLEEEDRLMGGEVFWALSGYRRKQLPKLA